MGLSPRIILLAILVIISLVFLQDCEAWRRRRFRVRVRVRRVIPTIRGRRIVRQVVHPRIRVRRISLPRIRIPLPRVRSIRLTPRLRRVCVNTGGYLGLSRCGGMSGGAAPPPAPTPAPPITHAPEAVTMVTTPYNPCAGILAGPEWEAPPVPPTGPFMFVPVRKVALYIDGINCTSRDACKHEAKAMYRESKNYNFMIGMDGTVFEGKGWNNVSNHIDQYNILEYGIAFIADCDPSNVALESANGLLECGRHLAKIHPEINYGEDLIFRFRECAENEK